MVIPDKMDLVHAHAALMAWMDADEDFGTWIGEDRHSLWRAVLANLKAGKMGGHATRAARAGFMANRAAR